MSWSARPEPDTAEYFDPSHVIRGKVKQVAALLTHKNTKRALIFTGAGLSTAAGIPDFRSGLNTAIPTGPGLWAAKADYERRTGGVRNEQTRNDPERPKVNLDRMLLVEPTFAHRAIAKLVEKGLVHAVLTQNVDNLHRKSGVPREKLIELHGNVQVERCENYENARSGCYRREFVRDFRVGPNPGMNHNTGRVCDVCGAPLKDYLIPFGEDLPRSETDRAWRESELADFCLVLGSSLTVTPACDYAGWVGRKTQATWCRQFRVPPAPKGDLVVVNIQKTPYDADAAVVLNAYCDEAMRALLDELGIELEER